MRDARRSTQRPKVDQPARLGHEKSPLGRPAGDPAVSYDVSQPIDGERLALAPAERAEIEARAFGQEVRVEVAEAGVPAAHDVAHRVDIVGRGVHAGERVQIGDTDRLLPKEGPAPPGAVATRAGDVTQVVHRLGLAHGAAQGAKLLNRD